MPFSFVISDLIISQFCNNFLLLLSGSTNTDYKCSNGDDIKLFSDAIILKHLELLHKLCSQTGRIIILCDTFTLGHEADGTQSPFNKVLEDYDESILSVKNITSSIINEWFYKYPYLLGSNIFNVVKDCNYNKIKYLYSNYWW